MKQKFRHYKNEVNFDNCFSVLDEGTSRELKPRKVEETLPSLRATKPTKLNAWIWRKETAIQQKGGTENTTILCHELGHKEKQPNQTYLDVDSDLILINKHGEKPNKSGE